MLFHTVRFIYCTWWQKCFAQSIATRVPKFLGNNITTVLSSNHAEQVPLSFIHGIFLCLSYVHDTGLRTGLHINVTYTLSRLVWS